MKRLTILAFGLLIPVISFSQQALWGGSQIVSPEIHDNHTITFRLRAPKAVKVEVTGDFLAPQKMETPYGKFDAPGTAQLKEGEGGVWEYTTPEPLASELYNYSYIVDGQRMNDPSNVSMVRDVASVSNLFIIPGDPGDLYRVMDVAHG